MSDHLTADQLSRHVKRTLSSAELLVVDNHLATCELCRKHAADSYGAGAAYSSLRRDLTAERKLAPTHLTYEELEKYVDDSMDATGREIVDSHVESCRMCMEELKDLRRFRDSFEAQIAKEANARVEIAALGGTSGFKEFRLAERDTLWSRIRAWWGRPLASAATAALVAAAVLVAIFLPLQKSAPPQPHEVVVKSTPPSSAEQPKLYSVAPRLDTPKELASLIGKQEALLAYPGNEPSFELIGPVGTLVEDVRPTFQWQQLPGVKSYKVSVFDTTLNKVATSEMLSGTEWKPTVPLKRGVIYLWQVSATENGHEVVSPTPPAPEARFEVLKDADAKRLAQRKQEAQGSHLELGRSYAEAGVIDAAEEELRQVPSSDRNYGQAQEFLRELKALRASARVSAP